jgi:hypothetical protein
LLVTSEAINAAIDQAQADPADPLHGLPHVEDPCEKINDALLVFFHGFFQFAGKIFQPPRFVH